MPKAKLVEEDSRLESDLIDTFLEGHKQYRPDLPFPESVSDMQGGIRALLKMYDIKRRPLATSLKYECPKCGGMRKFTSLDKDDKNWYHEEICPECHGKGFKYGKEN